MEGLARLPSIVHVGNSHVDSWPIHQVPLWNIAHLLSLAIPGFPLIFSPNGKCLLSLAKLRSQLIIKVPSNVLKGLVPFTC
jgi:hypothetical protein